MPDFRTEYQKIHEKIRTAILNGKYSPGERLPQRKLAEEYDTTTITVREALRSLENEDLILIEPKWGATVVEMTPEKTRGRYIVREALEGMAARLAAENIQESEKKELMAMAAQCDAELIGNNLSRQEKANLHYALHERIVEITGCEELIHSTKRTNLHSILLSNACNIDWQHDDPQRHRNLIHALNSNDPDRAEAEMRTHVQQGCAMELSALSGRR